MKYKIYLLNFSNYSKNLNLYQILSMTKIFLISWGGLDKWGLDKGLYGIKLINKFHIINYLRL